MGFTLTGLTKWVNENNKDVKAELFTSRDTTSHIEVLTDVTYKTKIKKLTGDVYLTDQRCGFDGSLNSTVLTDTEITVYPCTYNEIFCPGDLKEYSMSQFMKKGMLNINDTMPLEEVFAKYKIGKYNEKIEWNIWQGVDGTYTPGGGSPTVGPGGFIGFLTQFVTDANVDKTTVFDFTTASGSASDYIAAMHTVYNLLPAVAKSQNNVKFFMGYDAFNIYQQKLILLGNASLQLGGANALQFSNTLPLLGTNATVVGVSGLNGTGRVACTVADNMIFGCDLESELNVVKFVYDEATDNLKAMIIGQAGVAYHFGEYIVSNATA